MYINKYKSIYILPHHNILLALKNITFCLYVYMLERNSLYTSGIVSCWIEFSSNGYKGEVFPSFKCIFMSYNNKKTLLLFVLLVFVLFASMDVSIIIFFLCGRT